MRSSAPLDGLDGIGQVTSNLAASLPYVAVTVDRDAAADLGLSEVAVGALVSNTMQPRIDRLGRDRRHDADGLPRGRPSRRRRSTSCSSSRSRAPPGSSRSSRSRPSSRPRARPRSRRSGGQRTATVTVTPSTDDLATASSAVTTALADVDLPTGADATLGGVVTQQQDAFSQLGLALLAAILIVYIVMVATFKSLRQPLLLLDLGAVRGDRRDPAADHHGRAARRRVAHRRADADRHRGDERDRARRPREPVPREGPDGLRGDGRGRLATSAPDPHDGARHDLRPHADGARHHRARAASSRSRSRSS